jgi:hypothetical protein
MNKLFKTLSVLAAVAFCISACNAMVVPASREEQATPKVAPYKDVLGKSLTENVVADFIARNHCSSIMPYILCKEGGMDLLIDANQIVEGVFLYLNKSVGSVPVEEDFTPYQGELPLGLKFYDTMAAVEYKLKRQGVGNAGLPDLEGTPDHMHYVATYKQAGITIIYNSPPDEDALIYAILVRK